MGSTTIGSICALVVLGSSAWASADSARYDWSQVEASGTPEWNSAADSPFSWFLACLLVWPFFFPGYFWDRKYAPRVH